jgi:hypothetical protein
MKKKKLKKNYKNCICKEKNGEGHNRNALCWSFYIVNDNNIIDGSKLQIMRCMICCVNFVLYNPRTKGRRRIITYSKRNGIIAIKKHVDVDHVVLANRFEEKVKSPLRNVLKRQLAKKRPNMSNSKISKFFWCKRSF